MTERRGGGASAVQVLVGHRVAKLPDGDAIGPDAANTVEPSKLRRFLSDRHDWIAVGYQDLLDGSVRSSPPAARYLMTFDDGYHDNLTELLPILEEHKVKALIFVTTGFIGHSSLPPESVLAHIIEARDEIRTPDRGRHSSTNATEKRRIYETLRRKVKVMAPKVRDAYLGDLASINEVQPQFLERLFLNWDEVRELDRHPLITIGAHTRCHALLPRMTPRQAFEEIKFSKLELERNLGHSVDCFAYPYGGHNPIVRWLVARADFRLAFTTQPRHLDQCASRLRYRIPRCDLKSAIETVQS